uniref:Uncharacterized protein n=1 Tax=Arundo donax TaxID=35708 RepID=A0A0A8YVZ5_ARUDO
MWKAPNLNNQKLKRLVYINIISGLFL